VIRVFFLDNSNHVWRIIYALELIDSMPDCSTGNIYNRAHVRDVKVHAYVQQFAILDSLRAAASYPIISTVNRPALQVDELAFKICCQQVRWVDIF
jgi:hypothetical protein